MTTDTIAFGRALPYLNLRSVAVAEHFTRNARVIKYCNNSLRLQDYRLTTIPGLCDCATGWLNCIPDRQDQKANGRYRMPRKHDPIPRAIVRPRKSAGRPPTQGVHDLYAEFVAFSEIEEARQTIRSGDRASRIEIAAAIAVLRQSDDVGDRWIATELAAALELNDREIRRSARRRRKHQDRSVVARGRSAGWKAMGICVAAVLAVAALLRR